MASYLDNKILMSLRELNVIKPTKIKNLDMVNLTGFGNKTLLFNYRTLRKNGFIEYTKLDRQENDYSLLCLTEKGIESIKNY